MTESYITLVGKPQTELKHIFSPYRVCPIGAHVDHQHGLVTGFAIDKGVDLIYAPTEDGSVSLRSLTFDGDIDFSVRIPALVDPEKKESIRQAVTEKYLAQFPQYKDSFAVYFVRSDDGAIFV